MWAISAKSSDVESEFDGAMYVPSNTARDAGVVAIAELLEKVTVANWSFPCQRISFLVYLREDHLFNCFLCCALHDNPVRALDLY